MKNEKPFILLAKGLLTIFFSNLPSKIHKVFKGEVDESMGNESGPE